MSDLSPEGKALVRAARRALRPEDADRDRVFEALRGRLGDAAMVGQAPALQAVGTGGARATRLLLSRWSIAGLAVLGAAALLLGTQLSPRAPRSPSPVATAPAAQESASPPPADSA